MLILIVVQWRASWRHNTFDVIQDLDWIKRVTANAVWCSIIMNVRVVHVKQQMQMHRFTSKWGMLLHVWTLIEHWCKAVVEVQKTRGGWGRGVGGGGGWWGCYVRRFTRCPKFTDTWSPYMRHTAVSSPSYLGTSQKGKSRNMIQKNMSILLTRPAESPNVDVCF